MLVLGLDISTSVTAYSLVNTELPPDDFVVKYEGIHLSNLKTLYDKAEAVKSHLKELETKYEVDRICVEEALQSFRRGLSSAKTLSTLSRFNGIVCYLAEDIFKKEVELINVLHARSKLGIKIDRKSSENVKEQVLGWVRNHESLSSIEFPTKTLKSGPRKGQTILDKTCYDIADASVMALYGSISQS